MAIWASPAMEESRNDRTAMTPLTVSIEWLVEGTGNLVDNDDGKDTGRGNDDMRRNKRWPRQQREGGELRRLLPLPAQLGQGFSLILCLVRFQSDISKLEGKLEFAVWVEFKSYRGRSCGWRRYGKSKQLAKTCYV
jgi:hypothetical protein